ncbi:hypothetical protein G4G28_08345 [Massilia sp. Dwa41.01b]|uniref:hypothetical protein n=1 Tax=unclassified Massilia TaxID=2609279 RepID=UPI001603BA2E|nr:MULTISPECIES: hypothetical protein [unclassified Massilia]QNA88503.1 hypothetical protein G4G28_08345 [Massilia sp. Dwa41.01b]QNA99399.1 hypothetical protein G4G31_12015 [Massilia sp. Se16.2.3]
MNTKSTFPTLVVTAAVLAALLGGCKQKDAGIGGEGDAAAVTSRTPGAGNSSADGTVAGTGNAGNAGLSSTEYNTNVTPRTVGNEESTKQDSVGASGGASGVDGAVVVDGKGGTTGGANPGGSPTQATSAPGSKTVGHTGDTTGTGPASTKPGAGHEGGNH